MLQNLKNLEKENMQITKAIYGLKQPGREWFNKLGNTLKEIGFTSSNADPCVYTLAKGGDKVILALYVDDLIIAYSNENHMERIKGTLMNKFEMKDLGTLKYCLGVNFEYKNNAILVSQKHYIENLLKNLIWKIAKQQKRL